MKYIIIILLLSTNGLEEIKLKHNGTLKSCNEIAENWRQVNTIYYDQTETRNQGNYTSDNKLMVGYICE
jgi:hypothetical protein